MSYWPDGMKIKPIVEWPGEMTRNRVASNFASTLRSTKATLDRELRMLGAKDVLLQIAVPKEKWRLDGFPRSDAKPEHPGLILTMNTKHGPLSYPCDKFIHWEDNLRALALSLEALRMVDRYGVTKRGEQYRGFLAIEATAAPAGFDSPSAAWAFIKVMAGYDLDETPTPRLIRDAKRHAHPDTGGNAETFQRVTLAEQYLKQNGALQ